MRYRVVWVSKTTGAKATVQWFDSRAEAESWVLDMKALNPALTHFVEGEPVSAEPAAEVGEIR